MEFFQRLSPYRPVLWFLSALGLFILNGIFVYFALLQPEVMSAALGNPVSAVFIVEAFILVAFGAWMIWLLGLRRPGWLAFVLLSLLGGLVFSIPFFILLHLRKRDV